MTSTARDLLAAKNSAVVFTCPDDVSVREASRLMRDRRVGALVVVRGQEIQGLVTERHVVARVVAEALDPAQARVRDVMQRDVATVRLDEPAEEIEALLRRRRTRYVPVVGARGLLGMISLGDLARHRAACARALAEAVALELAGPAR